MESKKEFISIDHNFIYQNLMKCQETLKDLKSSMDEDAVVHKKIDNINDCPIM